MTLLDRIPILLRLDGPMTLSELTESSGYAGPSVRRACRILLEHDAIEIIEGQEGRPGLVYSIPGYSPPPPVHGPEGDSRPWGGVHLV